MNSRRSFLREISGAVRDVTAAARTGSGTPLAGSAVLCAAAATSRTAPVSSRRNERRLFTPRTILTLDPSTLTSWPASRAERGTFSSASLASRQRTVSSSPASIRSSSSLVATQVIGQVRPVMSSVRVT